MNPQESRWKNCRDRGHFSSFTAASPIRLRPARRAENNVKGNVEKAPSRSAETAEVDADILMHPRVWEVNVSTRCRLQGVQDEMDNLIDDFDEAHADGMTKEEMFQYMQGSSIPCPNW